MRYVFALLLLGVTNSLFANEEFLPWPKARQNAGAPLMNMRLDSDYGPRHPPTGSFFHLGLDLNVQNTAGDQDLDTPILAQAQGAVYGVGEIGARGIQWVGIRYQGL